MYSGTPTQRGAVGQLSLRTTPASAPAHTPASTQKPVGWSTASSANGV